MVKYVKTCKYHNGRDALRTSAAAAVAQNTAVHFLSSFGTGLDASHTLHRVPHSFKTVNHQPVNHKVGNHHIVNHRSVNQQHRSKHHAVN